MAIATRTKYIDTDGVVYYTLPGVWHNTSPITDENCVLLGWRIETEEYEVQEHDVQNEQANENVIENNNGVIIYSKLKLIRKLKELNVWETVKNFIQSAGMMDEWLASQNISSDDVQFLAVFDALNLGGVNKDAILESCKIDE